MIEVAGIWEQGWNYPLMEQTQWEMVMREFGVSRMNMVPVSGIKGRRLHEYADIGDVIADRGLEPVFVDENGETELTDFEHPENALYIMGRVSQSALPQYGKGRKSVRINTPKSGLLWPHQALAIVLYDRSQK